MTPDVSPLPYTPLTSAEAQRMLKRAKTGSRAVKKLFQSGTPPPTPRPLPAQKLRRNPWANAPTTAYSTVDSPSGASTQGSRGKRRQDAGCGRSTGTTPSCYMSASVSTQFLSL